MFRYPSIYSAIFLFEILHRAQRAIFKTQPIRKKENHGSSANRPPPSASAISRSRKACVIIETQSPLNPTYTEATLSGSRPRWAVPGAPRLILRSFGTKIRRYRYSSKSTESRSCRSTSSFLRCSTDSALESHSSNRIAPRVLQTASALCVILFGEPRSQATPLAIQLGIKRRARVSTVHTSSPISGAESGTSAVPEGLPAINWE